MDRDFIEWLCLRRCVSTNAPNSTNEISELIRTCPKDVFFGASIPNAPTSTNEISGESIGTSPKGVVFGVRVSHGGGVGYLDR